MSNTYPPTVLTDAEIAAVEVLVALGRRSDHYSVAIDVSDSYSRLRLQGRGIVLGATPTYQGGDAWTEGGIFGGNELRIDKEAVGSMAARLAEAEAQRDALKETLAAIVAPPSTGWAGPDTETTRLPAVGRS